MSFPRLASLLVLILVGWHSPVAAQETGSISGTVRAEHSGTPLEGVVVYLYQYDFTWGYWSFYWAAETDSSGKYTASDVTPGIYRIQFSDPKDSYISEFYDDASGVDSATDVSVDAATETSINATLSIGATISGQVTAQTGGAGLEGVDVEVYRYNARQGFWEGVWTGNTVSTDTLGNYTVGGLTEGSYRLLFRDPSGAYSPEFYNNALSVEAGQSVNVAEGAEISDINVALADGATISGTVTAADGVTALEGVNVSVYRLSNGFWQEQWSNSAVTDSLGEYTVRGLPAGTYRLGFRDPSGEYASEFYNNALTVEAGQSVHVAEGAEVFDINVALADGATISGQVTAKSNGDALEGVRVSVHFLINGFWDPQSTIYSVTDSLGNYTIRGLVAGTYRVGFSDPSGDYATEYYNDALTVEVGQSVSVSEGGDLTEIDAALVDGATISGRVTADVGGEMAGMEGILVQLYRYDSRSGGWTFYLYWTASLVSTNENGDYTIRGLPAGTYRVEFVDPAGNYARGYHGGTLTVETAKSVVAGEGDLLVDIDAALTDGATVQGTITNSTGAGLKGILVDVHRYNTQRGYWEMSYIGDPPSTDGSGNYTVRGLRAGTYRINFSDPTGLYAGEYYGDSPVFGRAINVMVGEGGSIQNIDAALDLAAAIRGTITDVQGEPLEAILATVYYFDPRGGSWSIYTSHQSTDFAGQYEVKGLPAGTYRVEFHDPSGTYAKVYHGGASMLETAKSVVVSEGGNLDSVDATLAAGASISGTVTADSGGSALPWVQIDVFEYDPTEDDWDQLWFNNTIYTDASGNYVVRGLPAGQYRLRFLDSSGVYAQEYSGGALTLDTATTVEVGEGLQVGDVDAGLSVGASISGGVKADAGDVPLEGIRVEIYRYEPRHNYWNSFWLGYDVYTDASGNYSVRGLPPGDYRVGFSDGEATHAPEFFDDVWTVDAATTVNVPAAEPVEGINASLARAGTIRGRVTDANNAPLQGILVEVYEYELPYRTWNTTRFTANEIFTDAEGNYAVAGLAPGTYRVEFRDPRGIYAKEFYSNSPMVETGTNVSVLAGGEASYINASLTAASSISGKVSSQQDNIPLEGVEVEVYRFNDEAQAWQYFWTGASVVTDVSGDYTVWGLPAGTYALEFRERNRVYATQFYSDNPAMEPASGIEIGAEIQVTGKNVALATGATIRGVVRDQAASTPLANIQVNAYLWIEGLWLQVWQSAYTDASGAFAISGLAPGRYRVGFSDPSDNYADGFYNGAYSVNEATDVFVIVGSDVTLETALLGASASISGRVTGPDAQTALANITVKPYRWDEALQTWEQLEAVWSFADGTFRFATLPPGSYILEFVDESGAHLVEFYNNAPNRTAANSIELAGGGSIDNLGVSLALAGYDAWQSGAGLIGSRADDDDGDGLSNGAEYALGTNPLISDSGSALVSSSSGSNLTLEFIKLNQGASYSLQEISDLQSGNWLNSQAEMSESPDQSGVTIGYTRMRCTVPATGQKFFRVQATY